MPARDIAAALLVVVLWGFNFVVMKHAVSEVSPLLLTALRFALAAFPAILFVPRPATSWGVLIAFGTAFGIVKFSLLFLAFRLGMPAGLASIVLQLHAFFAVMLAVVLYREVPRPVQGLGLAAACAGLGVIAAGEVGGVVLVPLLLTVAAGFAWALATMAVKRAGTIDMLGFAVWISIVPPLPMLALSLVFEGAGAITGSLQGLSLAGIGAVLYLAWPVSLYSTALWSGLLARYPAATVAPFSLLVPLIGTASGYLVYGETLRISVLAGGALILVGLALIVLAGGRRKDA